MKFEFTIKDLEVETFNRVSLGRIKKQFAEYAGKRIGVYDYSIARSDDSVGEYTVVFRILKPRYQFESGNEKALKKLVDEFYNQVQAIDALSSILKLSNKYGTDSLEFYTYEISRHGYCAWFNTIYSDIVVYISYVNGTISVNVVYDGSDDIRDCIITLVNGVELVTEGTGWDSVYMEIQKTVKVKTDQLDTLLKKVEKAVKQVQEITVEDN